MQLLSAGMLFSGPLLFGKNMLQKTKGEFGSLHHLNEITLHNNRLVTLDPNLFTNLPRPLLLSVNLHAHDRNQWNCSLLSWLMHEEHHNTITWRKEVPNPPVCAGNRTWSNLSSGQHGKLDSRSSCRRPQEVWPNFM